MRPILTGALLLALVGFFGWLLIPLDPALQLRPAEAAPGASALSQNVTLPPKPAPDLAAGKEAYLQNCARCHGLTGAGDGQDAKRMFPHPRKLSDGIFKFRTTASGTPPTDEDLFRTISTGLPGSRMPDFQRLPEDARWQLVYYVKSFSPVFNEQKPEPLDLGVDPGPKNADPAKEKELYTQLGCASCHGNFGRGDGPSAPTLKDNWGNPIRAADLTHGWSYRAGSAPADIVARVMSGIDGAPMPSYAEALSSKEDAWQLAYYVRSLQEKPNFRRVIEAVNAPGRLPTTAEDPIWEKAPRTELPLNSNFYRQGELLSTTVTAISVQAVYNEEKILFRLVWNDPSESGGVPPDSVAVALMTDRRSKLEVGSLRNWPADHAESEGSTLELLRWSAADQKGESQATYADGRWTVLLARPLHGSEAGAAGRVNLTPGKPVLFGMMAWDGTNAEEGRHHANSNWIDLVLTRVMQNAAADL